MHFVSVLQYLRPDREGKVQCRVCCVLSVCNCVAALWSERGSLTSSVRKLGARVTCPFHIYQWHHHAWTHTIVFSSVPTNDHLSWWCNGGEVKGREQDQGILRFGGQVWQWGKASLDAWLGWLSAITGGGLCVAWLLRRIRCSHYVVTQELVTGDVMRSDYRLVHRLAAKGWPIIPQSLKERFVKSGWKRGKKETERMKKRGEYKRCVGELNNTWFDMKSLLLPPRRSPARKDVREASRETPTTRKQDMPCSGFKEQTD